MEEADRLRKAFKHRDEFERWREEKDEEEGEAEGDNSGGLSSPRRAHALRETAEGSRPWMRENPQRDFPRSCYRLRVGGHARFVKGRTRDDIIVWRISR
ncbi:hypothetical protein DRP77_13425 [Candidatus Poribacteria bacterium]|nr:MAG: hypothetical protein DRP77_13425 [Candidatus Poribacteria bacterium]